MNNSGLKKIGGGILVLGVAIASKTGLLRDGDYVAEGAFRPAEVFESWSKEACACADFACAEAQAKRLDELIAKNPAQEGRAFKVAQAAADVGQECIMKIVRDVEKAAAAPAVEEQPAKPARSKRHKR